LTYIDTIVAKEKEAKARIISYEEPDIHEDGKAVQVSTRTLDPEVENRVSMQELRKKMDNSPWTELEIHDLDSEMSRNAFEYLFSNDQDDYIENLEFSYIDKISSMQRESEVKQELGIDCNSVSIIAKIRAIVISSQVVDLSTVKRLLDEDIDDKTLIGYICETAVMIRGCFVCRSEFMYVDRPLFARNYLLLLFLENDHVKRSEFVAESKLLPEMAVNMLREIARLEPNGWKLKAKCDLSIQQRFFKLNYIRFPSIVAEQANIVIENSKEALKSMNITQVKLNSKIIKKNQAVKIQPGTQASSATNKPIFDLTGIPIKGTSLIEQITNFLRKIVASYGPISFENISEAVKLRSEESKPHNLMKDSTPELINTYLLEVGICMYDLW
jgi:hypothetical protein